MFDIDPKLVFEQLQYDPHSPMIFSSGVFLFLFLGFTLVYGLLSRDRHTTVRLLFVTAFSYYFYYKSSGFYFFLLAVVTLSDYLLAHAIHRCQSRARARWLVAASLVIDLGFLVYFKYTNFFCGIFAGEGFVPFDIFLPVGISFFTFQSLSYTIDVYRGQLTPLRSLLDYAFFVSFFPQLVAGPIVRARDFIPQIRQRLNISHEMFARGIFLIIVGLFKKAVIGDFIAVNFVERVFDEPTLYSGIENLLAVYGYALQIYCDFSGYSDMAIGIALLLGFQFPKNFDAPYKSSSITEFWRRWHISLSGWLRDYLYISLGGNRHGRIRQLLNLMATMLLGGLWHGANWTFVMWGALHGLMLCIDKLCNKHWLRTHPYRDGESSGWSWSRFWRIALTFHLVCLCWIFFRCQSIDQAFTMIGQIVGNLQPQIFFQWVGGYWAVAALMLLGFALHFMPSRLSLRTQSLIAHMPLAVQALCIVVVAYIVIQVKSADVQPFIYFQF